MRTSLKIEKEGGMGKYLGLPESFGRSKRDVFTGIFDRIRQRSLSWTTHFLSGAGKHVLLQSVLSALSNHTMSYFKIPISLCKRIQSILIQFWWDSSPNKRKIAWVAWDTMASPKFLGGLGFKDIESTNIALLGKLSWRIYDNPDSLLAQVLKGKYFPDCSFLESTSKQGSSHGWASIMAGKNLMREGMGFIIGNGESVNVWSEPWLSSTEALRPLGPVPESLTSHKVCHLLIPDTNEWNIPKTRETLPLYEEVIRSIIPSASKPLDKQVWLGEKTGIYSTKSGYKLASLSCSETPSFKDAQCLACEDIEETPTLPLEIPQRCSSSRKSTCLQRYSQCDEL